MGPWHLIFLKLTSLHSQGWQPPPLFPSLGSGYQHSSLEKPALLWGIFLYPSMQWSKSSNRIKNHSCFCWVEELILVLQAHSHFMIYFQLHWENKSNQEKKTKQKNKQKKKTNSKSSHYINPSTQICGFPPHFSQHEFPHTPIQGHAPHLSS